MKKLYEFTVACNYPKYDVENEDSGFRLETHFHVAEDSVNCNEVLLDLLLNMRNAVNYHAADYDECFVYGIRRIRRKCDFKGGKIPSNAFFEPDIMKEIDKSDNESWWTVIAVTSTVTTVICISAQDKSDAVIKAGVMLYNMKLVTNEKIVISAKEVSVR